MGSSLLETLVSIEERVSHVDFLLQDELGHRDVTQLELITVAAQLKGLGQDFKDISSEHPIIANFLNLHARVKNLLGDDGRIGERFPVPLEQKELVIRSSAASFSRTASDLDSLHENIVPDFNHIITLLSQEPRLYKALELQRCQDDELSRLKLASSQVLAKWYQVSVLEAGGSWAELEQRILNIDRALRLRENEHVSKYTVA